MRRVSTQSPAEHKPDEFHSHHLSQMECVLELHRPFAAFQAAAAVAQRAKKLYWREP
jgi:hypothetical protein